MASARLSLLILTMCFVACSSNSKDNPDSGVPDSGVNDAGTFLTHHAYVTSQISLPATSTQAAADGLDLDGDGKVDNQLGQVLSTLTTLGFDSQTALQTSIARGNPIQILDLQTQSFSDSSTARLTVEAGDKATALPPPCASASDQVCGQHLHGTGSFTIDASAPVNTLSGSVAAGTFTGGPGTLSVPFLIGGGTPISLSLIGARAKVTGMTDTGLASGILAGAVAQTDVNTLIMPALALQMQVIVARDCTDPGSPPHCGCASGTAGATVISLFDTAQPHDCSISVDEVRTNGVISSLFVPDVTINGVAAVSFGIKVEAVKATLPASVYQK